MPANRAVSVQNTQLPKAPTSRLDALVTYLDTELAGEDLVGLVMYPGSTPSLRCLACLGHIPGS